MSAGGSVFVPADAAARRRASGVDAADRRGHLLVEAAAGTGKTTVLIERVLHTVRNGDRPLSRIAVVTFTEAAAAELKERLRSKVSQLLATPETDLAETAEEAAAQRQRLTEALADLEVAAVGTIHSFCLELLKQRPVEAGVDPGFKVADAFQQRILKTRAWESMLRRMESEEAGLDAAYDLGLANERELRRIALSLAAVERRRLPKPERGTLEQWPHEWSRLGATLERALSLANPSGKLAQRLHGVLADYRELAGQGEREQQRALLAAEFKIAKVGGTQQESEAKAARAEARDLLDALTATLWDVRLRELAWWLSGLQPAYRQLAQREGWLDFDSLIRLALDTLKRQPHVLADFRRRYPVLLVDEFQDTDPLQTELILLLAGEEKSTVDAEGPRSLFLVGDPKQSIYRFRGADLENYNRVLDQAMGAQRRVTLTQSFRPLPAIAAWVNEVMERVMRPAGPLPAEAAEAAEAAPKLQSYEAPYRELIARPLAAQPAEGGVLYLEIDLPAKGSVEENREIEAEGFARCVHHLVAAGRGQVRDRRSGEVRGATYGDIALLLPKLTMLDTYERVFHRRGLPFRVIGGRHYYRRDEVHALISILKALADPGDPVAVVAALRGPGFGVSDAQLAAWALCRPRPRLEAVPGASRPDLASSPDPAAAREVAAALDLLRALHMETRRLALPELVSAVLERTGLLAFFALQWRGEQRVANLRKVVEVARRVEAGGVSAPSAFVRWLESLLEEEPEESDSPYLEGTGATVQLMTVHKAKGLEFPIVLLGGLPSGAGRGSERLRTYERDDGQLALYLARGRATRGAQAAHDRDKLRQEAESKRLLYVAATRARDLLVLPYSPAGAARQGDLFDLLYAEGVGHPSAVAAPHRLLRAGDLAPLAEQASGPRIDGTQLTADGGRERLRRRDQALAAVGGLSARSTLLRPSDEEPSSVGAPSMEGGGEEVEKRRAAFRIGDAAHLLLESELSGSTFDDAPLSPRLTAAEHRAALQLARRFLGSDLERRARAVAPERRFTELSVTLAAAGEEAGGEPRVLDGQIDLAFEEDDGWVVVDYKTNRLRAGQEAARAKGYEGQLGLYAEALSRIAGTPVKEVHLFFLATGEAVRYAGERLAALRSKAACLIDG